MRNKGYTFKPGLPDRYDGEETLRSLGGTSDTPDSRTRSGVVKRPGVAGPHLEPETGAGSFQTPVS